MIELKQFRADDLMVLANDTSADMALTAYFKEKCGIAWTAVKDGAIVGAAGLAIADGQGAVWTVFSQELRKYPLFLHRTVKQYLRAVLNSLPYYRVEAFVDPAKPENCRWIEALGFKFEGIRQKAGENGADVAVYVILK